MVSKELYIGNINPDTKSQEIKEIFKQYGNINRCEVKFAGSGYSVAFGFVGFEFNEDAERAQRKEHGRNFHGRRLIVEFTKTTPGQNGRRGRYINHYDEHIIDKNNNKRNQSKSYNGDHLRSKYRQRRRSSSYNRRSSRDRSSRHDHRRKRDRSQSSHNYKSKTKRHCLSSNNNKYRNSQSYKNENSKTN